MNSIYVYSLQEDTDSTTHKFTWPTTTEVEDVTAEEKDTDLNRNLSKSSDDVSYNKGTKHSTRSSVVSSAPPLNQQHSAGFSNTFMAYPNNQCGYGLNGGMMASMYPTPYPSYMSYQMGTQFGENMASSPVYHNLYNNECKTYEEMQSFRNAMKTYRDYQQATWPSHTRTSLLRCSRFWQDLILNENY
ncbi:uncharacterized protein LOC106674195 [Cimex lectularius]|uniref:GATA-type transcription activator N-terminal domain-containing protein n=1 Tax=Cimex lectularius TaxID=79782 RepID=A0A8I6SBZ0_CIMLE|nr:uncharacterized protein LOC106674195 [Cimex lectularius]